MTRKDFFDYLKESGCETFPPNEYGEANCIGILNPKTKAEAYLDTPIDEREMRPFTIGQLCSQLGVEPPDCAVHVKPMIEEIAKTDFTRFSPKFPPPTKN